MRLEWTILVDTREQKPLPFPAYLPIFDPASSPASPRLTTVRLLTKKQKLDTGDYCLESHPTIGIIERKADLSELHGNLCTKDGLARFFAELHRLRGFRNPCLLLESTDPAGRRGVPIPGFTPSAVRDLLLINCVSRGLPLYTFNVSTSAHRVKCAEWAASFLIMSAICSEIQNGQDSLAVPPSARPLPDPERVRSEGPITKEP